MGEFHSKSQDPGSDSLREWAVPGLEFEPLEAQSSVAVELVQELQELAAYVADRTGNQDFAEVDDQSLAQVIANIEYLGNAVSHAQLVLAAEVRKRSSLRDQDESFLKRHGYRSEAAYLRDITKTSMSEAKSRLRLSESLHVRTTGLGFESPPRFEHLAQASADGAVVPQVAEIITKTLLAGREADSELLELAERCLVEAATGRDCGSGNPVPPRLDADAVRQLCSGWSELLDQDGNPPAEEGASSRRSIWIGTARRGLVEIHGHLVPEVAALFGRTLDAVNSYRQSTLPTQADADSCPDIVEADGTAWIDERTSSQKRHDAFAAILNLAAKSSDMPQLGGAPVTVLIQVSEDEIRKPYGTAWVQDAHGRFDRMPASGARHAACAGALQHFTMTKNGKIKELGTPHRIFNANQRRVIAVRDGGCVIPGCSIPSTWCEIHHLLPHSEGGPTHVENGVMLCWYHHRSLEETGWELRVKEGQVQTRAPSWHPHHNEWRTHTPFHRTAARGP